MRIDGEGFSAKCRVHNHIGGLAAHAGQCLQRIAVRGHFACMTAHEDLGQRDDVLCLVVVKANGLDMRFQAIQPKRDHLRGRLYIFKQSLRRLVDTHIG